MTTTESSGTVVILDVLTRGSPALRGGVTDRWRVVESIPAAGSGRCGLVGVSDGADAALRHALQDPEIVEVLVLVSLSAIRPANAAGDANDDAAELEARLAHVQCPTLVVFGQEDWSVQREAAGIYRERIPNCNIAFVYAAGHDIMADRPQALVNLASGLPRAPRKPLSSQKPQPGHQPLILTLLRKSVHGELVEP